MEIKFYIQIVSELKFYTVKPNENYLLLSRFTDTNWTPKLAQTILDGVKKGITQPKETAYEWANEDIYIISNEHDVFLLDLIGERAGEKDIEKLSLRLSHTKFITFMEDFKLFIEENQ